MTGVQTCALPILIQAKSSKVLTLVEIKVALNSRKDLGRPTTTPEENKEKFMEYIIEGIES